MNGCSTRHIVGLAARPLQRRHAGLGCSTGAKQGRSIHEHPFPRLPPVNRLYGDTGKMIIAFVKERILNERRCILIVTHDARINEYADRILSMEDGRISEPASAAL